MRHLLAQPSSESLACLPMKWETYKLQAILFFVLARIHGETRLEAVTRFTDGDLCKLGGAELTVGMVYGFAAAAGYEN